MEARPVANEVLITAERQRTEAAEVIPLRRKLRSICTSLTIAEHLRLTYYCSVYPWQDLGDPAEVRRCVASLQASPIPPPDPTRLVST